jgi:hypothetical protein
VPLLPALVPLLPLEPELGLGPELGDDGRGTLGALGAEEREAHPSANASSEARRKRELMVSPGPGGRWTRF